MKLAEYEIREALRARDWRAAIRCLADHFGIAGELGSLESPTLHEYVYRKITPTALLVHGNFYYYWDGKRFKRSPCPDEVIQPRVMMEYSET